MIYIDLLANLNLEDDHGLNVARLADAIDPDVVTPGAVPVAGAPAPGHGLSSRVLAAGSSTFARSAPKTPHGAVAWSSRFLR
jgi:hypothetical protein